MSLIYLPKIGDTGRFNFLEPYASGIATNIEYKVDSIRAIAELIGSGEKPLELIYTKYGMTEADYADDILNNIPIVILVTTGNEYVYVPADRLQSIALINGIKYQEKVIVISLGNIPIEMDLTLVKSQIEGAVEEATGIKSTTAVINRSAVTMKEPTDHLAFMQLLANSKSVYKTDRTRLIEMSTAYNEAMLKIQELEQFILDNYVPPSP